MLSAGGWLTALHALQQRPDLGRGSAEPGPYGPIGPVADLATGLPLLQLPAGFRYRSVSWSGDAMDDGNPAPELPDGMAVIEARGGEVVLVRNHEVGESRHPIVAPATYDRVVLKDGKRPGGGTTTLVFRDSELRSVHASLAGTLWNCAGGPTPWGTWLSCEETDADLTEHGGRRHGYVFEVRSDAAATTARPIVAMGRFQHEAVAIDPATRHAYLTEDARHAAGLYRFVPIDRSGKPGAYERGGKLQMARVKGIDQADLSVPSPDMAFDVDWIDIGDPDADPVVVNAATGTSKEARVSGPFWQGWRAGGLRLARGEGIWFAQERIYIVDTAAGTDAQGRRGRGNGAVWELDPRRNRLRLLFVSPAQRVLANPDNITVSPRGGLLLCEDGGAVADSHGSGSRLVGLTAGGGAYLFAKNHITLDAVQLARARKRAAPGDYRGSEFCGACFDPAASTLFVNVQSPGITFAIQGPFGHGPL